ncbi:MarR family winged helix-turn-helix transcriptional regulator [Antarcticirhabdus aurantiaca]|uniref:MarR family winged helix-turn-helix transcriptional regulator n=1 Tax=Antarcticirhabdus aurantiaca TaxID=2606717 RepID=UPI00131E9549|nr:MarR family winged helix-turn-helix transcriptional regulator [Antarcticirhabdus aurantiaca]
MVFALFGLSPAFIAARDDRVQAFKAGIEVVRNVHPSMTIGMLYTLLTAAEYYDIHFMQKKDMSALAEQVGVPYTTLVRQVELLGEGIAKRGGLGLVEKHSAPYNGKAKIVRITDEGLRMMQSIIEAMKECEAKIAATEQSDGSPRIGSEG